MESFYEDINRLVKANSSADKLNLLGDIGGEACWVHMALVN